MKITAIIPAAGFGRRMGGAVPKQFMYLAGRPILDYILTAFEDHGGVESVILTVPEEEVETVTEKCKAFAIVKQVIAGGEQRQDSVYNGLKSIEKGTDLVIVHDGVRPFLTVEMIESVIKAATEYSAAITAIPVSDTVKRATEEGWVDRTIDRSDLWRVQTPQAFRYDLLRRAFEKAMADSYYGTDESSLVEYIGQPVKIIMGSLLNIKITRPEDLVLGEKIALLF